MPITSSAKKKARRDVRKRMSNLSKKNVLKKTIKIARRNSTPDTLKAAYKAIDKSAKRNLIHKNKAARLKSKLAKQLRKH